MSENRLFGIYRAGAVYDDTPPPFGTTPMLTDSHLYQQLREGGCDLPERGVSVYVRCHEDGRVTYLAWTNRQRKLPPAARAVWDEWFAQHGARTIEGETTDA